MKPSDSFQAHRQALREIVARHGVARPRVLGSAARGDDHEGSDLDLLVEPAPTTTLFTLSRRSIGRPVTWQAWTTQYLKDTRTQDAVIRALEIVGEAANKAWAADQTLQDAAPEMPWDVMYGMRNRIVHDYFEVDLDVVWQSIQRDLPVLRR